MSNPSADVSYVYMSHAGGVIHPQAHASIEAVIEWLKTHPAEGGTIWRQEAFWDESPARIVLTEAAAEYQVRWTDAERDNAK